MSFKDMSLSPRLGQILRSRPPSSFNIDQPTPYRIRIFLNELSSLNCRSFEIGFLQASIAPHWPSLWLWMKPVLKTMQVFEFNGFPSDAIHNRVIECVQPPLAFISAFMESLLSASNSNSALSLGLLRMIMEAPELQELVALSLIVGLHIPNDSNYTHLIMKLLGYTKNICADLSITFIDVLQTVAKETTELSILGLWKIRVEEEILVRRPCGNGCQCLQKQHRCVDGIRLFFFLQFLDLPGNIFHARFDVVVDVWTLLHEMWDLLIAVTDVHITFSEVHASDKTILYSLSKILNCHKLWMSGGALWVAKALDFHLIEYVAKTAFFLRQLVSTSSPYFDIYLSNCGLLSDLLTCVHCFKIYRMVAYRIYRELKVAHNRLPLQLVLEERPEELGLLSICKQLEAESDRDAVLLRKVLWRKALSHTCAWPACKYSALDHCNLCSSNDETGHRIPCPSRSRDHKLECPEFTAFFNEHPLYKITNSSQAIFPPLERRYIENVLQRMLEKLMPEISDIARCKGLDPESLFVDLDLRGTRLGVDVQSQANFLQKTTDPVTRQILMESRLPVVCRGRVPVTSTMSTFIGLVHYPLSLQID
ncbi:hypothetical protein EV360DRAFT_84663 [Lentinula raphanica]|nr:hypothetical protein EV360DRAFT_84663 [Lentinula raphanica]